MKIIGINSSHDTSLCQYDTETGILDFMHEEERFRREKYWTPLAMQQGDEGFETTYPDQLQCIHKGGVETPDKLVMASFDRRNIQLHINNEKLMENRMLSIEVADYVRSEPMTNQRCEDFCEKFGEFGVVDGIGFGGEHVEEYIHDGFAGQFEGVDDYYFWFEHHIYHAYCGYHLSPYIEQKEDAIAIVMDGGGARLNYDTMAGYQEIESIYRMSPNQPAKRQWVLSSNHRFLGDLKGSNFPNQQEGTLDYMGENLVEDVDGVIYEYTSRASNGMDFSNMSHALGCDDQGRAAGKVMGMASYGIVDSDYKRFNKFSISQELELNAFEETCKTIQKGIDMNPDCKNILLSGGYALNCTNNYKYLSRFPEHQFYVDPIPHDGGTAFGACIHLEYLMKTGEENNATNTDT
jgi:predicted NodU family carbamoyl transferase|tara:strand:+ start:1011 stop:2231 length:1221 start_codon:yes stop_codon:yes gene_type:complete